MVGRDARDDNAHAAELHELDELAKIGLTHDAIAKRKKIENVTCRVVSEGSQE